MARPTNLKILSERVAFDDPSADTRPVSEAFPSPPEVTDPGLKDDVLALLRQSHERIGGEVAAVREVAGQAVEQARHSEAIAHQAGELAKQANAKSAATSLAVGSGKIVSSVVGFLADRAPALFALIGGFLLAQQVLADPNLLKLGGLALYCLGVVAPAAWLSKR